MTYVNTEIADKYQDFFNFFSQEHNLILTIEQMQEILSEAQKLESKSSQHDIMLTFADLEDGILKHKAKSEYKQASIIIVRDVFKANAT